MDIHVEKHDARIWLASRYNYDIKERCAAQPGAGWADGPNTKAWAIKVAGHGAGGVWTFPLNYRTCMDLRREFGRENLVIHEKLWEWASEEAARRRDLRDILRAKDYPTPTLEREYPRLAEAVHARPFQSVGIGFAKRARVSLNGDQPGLGKTLQAAGTAVEMGLRGALLVVAPTGAQRITWPDEFADWLPNERFHLIDGSNKDKRRRQIEEFWETVDRDRKRRHWMFSNQEMLQRDRVSTGNGTFMTTDDPRFPGMFLRPWNAIIVDESHNILPTKSSKPKDQSMMRAGAQELPLMPFGLKMALSGTPWRGYPLNMWGTLNWLRPAQYPGYWAFVERWFEITQVDESDPGEIGDVIASQEKDYGRELDAIMIRRTKMEVAPQLPPKHYGGTHLIPGDASSPHAVWIDLTPKQRRAYDLMAQHAAAELDSGQLAANGRLAEIIRAKQLAVSYGDVRQATKRVPGMFDELGRPVSEEVTEFYPTLPSNKLDWLREFAAERGIQRKPWGDGKIVVASQFTQTVTLFAEQLAREGIPSHLFTGRQKMKDKREAKHMFQGEGGPRIFFLNIKAGGVSLTLDAADDLVFLDEDWGPDPQEQVEDRIHRLSRMHQVTIWYVRSRNTIDEYIAGQNESLDRIQKRLMDGRRGVAYTKFLLTGEAAA